MGKGKPLPGDRAAWDAKNYPLVHTNDIDTLDGIHHTLGTDATQAAPGNHVHDERYYTESETDTLLNGKSDTTHTHSHFTDTANPHSVTKDQVGLGDVANLKCNLAATAAPTTGDDSADGYAVGSSWFDVTNDKAYLCLDATVDAAVWQEVGAGSGGASTLHDLTDVDDTGKANGDRLTYNATTSKWEPEPLASNLDGLTDVVITTPATGQVLKYDGTNWKNDSDLVGTGGSDATAIHDDTAGEISLITEKTSLADNDLFLIEDSAASYAKKRVKKSNLGLVGSSGASVVQTSTASGASPLSLTTTGIQEGDVVIAAITTRNSVAGSITGGATWKELWYVDVGSDEETRVFWKVAGASEPASYSWTHSAGSTTIAALVIYRGLNGTLIHYGRASSRTSPVVLGSSNGLHILIMQCCYLVSSLTLDDPTSLLTVDLNYDNNDQGIIIASRDTKFPAAQPGFYFSGGDNGYVSSGAIVIE